jgi:hypothetical protein
MSGLAGGVGVVVLGDGLSSNQFDAIRRTIQSQNIENVVFRPQTMNEAIAQSLAERRFAAILLDSFAVLALLLASIGLYGVISYLVGQRTQELGIRIALGAQRKDVLSLVLADGIKMTLAGVGVGLLASLGLTRLLTKMVLRSEHHRSGNVRGDCRLVNFRGSAGVFDTRAEGDESRSADGTQVRIGQIRTHGPIRPMRPFRDSDMDTLIKDIRFGVRSLLARPALRPSPCSRWQSASELVPRSSVLSMVSCCDLCHTRTPNGSCNFGRSIRAAHKYSLPNPIFEMCAPAAAHSRLLLNTAVRSPP